MTQRHKDISGKRFGRLIVKHRTGTTRHRQAVWMCQCDCGVISYVATAPLTCGQVVSCGCARRDAVQTHGLSHLREYRCWRAMMSRCYNPSNNRHDSYGRRGIIVCAAWRMFEGFLAGMGKASDDDMTIERIETTETTSPVIVDGRASRIRRAIAVRRTTSPFTEYANPWLRTPRIWAFRTSGHGNAYGPTVGHLNWP
mgnify:CR=1 FL=1